LLKLAKSAAVEFADPTTRAKNPIIRFMRRIIRLQRSVS
jgi:hypothetical protein